MVMNDGNRLKASGPYPPGHVEPKRSFIAVSVVIALGLVPDMIKDVGALTSPNIERITVPRIGGSVDIVTEFVSYLIGEVFFSFSTVTIRCHTSRSSVGFPDGADKSAGNPPSTWTERNPSPRYTVMRQCL